jgi:ribose 5-phosphate isomerase A
MKPKQDWIERAKKNAAVEAVKHVKDCFIVGLGSGSTAAYAIEEIGSRMKHEGLSVLGVPTSSQAFMLAVRQGIAITTLDEHPTLDLTIDGVDQIDAELNMIKGMGGALTREKIVASASKKNIAVADETKTVRTLGENDHPIPIEVLPFAIATVMRKIQKTGGKPALREGKGKVGPIVTDNGNFIIDARFGVIREPARLERELNMIPGVVETGLFLRTAALAYVGKASGVEKLMRK